MSPWLLRILTLFTCFALVSCGKIPLFSDLEEEEVNEIMSVLMDRSIPCVKVAGKEGKWGVEVAPEDFSQSMQVLQAIGLPKETFQKMGDIFQKTGLVSSPTEERIRFINALSQEISSTLMQIDGVVSARVHIALPDNNPLSEKTVPPSAAIFIKHRAGYDIESVTPDLKNLVSRSIEGLDFENVQLVITQADAMPPVLQVRQTPWYEKVPLWGWCGGSALLAIILSWFIFGRKKAGPTS